MSDGDSSGETRETRGQRDIVLHLLDLARWRQQIALLLRSASVGFYQLPSRVIDRCATFMRHEDAERCAAGEILRVIALAAYGGERLARSPVERSQYGKPFLPLFPDVEFNLSHSGNLLLCAVDRFPIGVDVEQIGPVDTSLVHACFTAAEQERLGLLAMTNPLQAHGGFHHLWTMKESLLKGIGHGLQIDPVDMEMAPTDAEGRSWRCVGLRQGGREKADSHSTRDLAQQFVVYPVAMPSGYAAAVAVVGPATIRTVVHNNIDILERNTMDSFSATSNRS